MNKNRIFIIPCFFNGSNTSIFNCVDSILKFYKNPKIVVIDSNSPDKSYFKELIKKKVTILDVKNKNYDTGAYWIGYKRFPNYKFYYFLHDSIFLKQNLKFYEQFNLTTLRFFMSINMVGRFKIKKSRDKFYKSFSSLIKKNKTLYYCNGFDDSKQIQWCFDQIKKTNYFVPKTWVSVFGPIFFCKPRVLQNLIKKKFDKILPKNKVQAQGMERLFGIAFQQEGLDVTNSLQGDINNTKLHKKKAEKLFFNRL
jgi:hypothetical protein